MTSIHRILAAVAADHGSAHLSVVPRDDGSWRVIVWSDGRDEHGNTYRAVWEGENAADTMTRAFDALDEAFA